VRLRREIEALRSAIPLLSCTSIQNQPSMEIATNVTANYTVRPAG